MKKMKKKPKYVQTYIISFFCVLLMGILIAKFGLSGGKEPQSWQEIYSKLPIIVGISLFLAFCWTIKTYIIQIDKKEK